MGDKVLQISEFKGSIFSFTMCNLQKENSRYNDYKLSQSSLSNIKTFIKIEFLIFMRNLLFKDNFLFNMILVVSGKIQCEAPNNKLNQFEGRLLYNGNALPLDNQKTLLRGCVLRNTRWCYGVVIFAGYYFI